MNNRFFGSSYFEQFRTVGWYIKSEVLAPMYHLSIVSHPWPHLSPLCSTSKTSVSKTSLWRQDCLPWNNILGARQMGLFGFCCHDLSGTLTVQECENFFKR